MIWSATFVAVSLGMAKPTPMLPSLWPSVAMAVLMPMTRPAVSTSGPPELPGLIAASVWIASEIVDCRSLLRSRCTALTMPAVTVPSRPSGLPMARTVSPTWTSALGANVAAVSPETPAALTTARSLAASVPTIVAVAVLPSENVSRTVLPRAVATTWLLVSTYPSAVNTTPDPSAEPVLIDTTLGWTFAATAASEPGLDAGAADVAARAVAGLPPSNWLLRYPPATPDETARTPAARAAAVTRTKRPGRRVVGAAGSGSMGVMPSGSSRVLRPG